MKSVHPPAHLVNCWRATSFATDHQPWTLLPPQTITTWGLDKANMAALEKRGTGSALASTLLADCNEQLVCVLAQLLALQAAGLRLNPRCC